METLMEKVGLSPRLKNRIDSKAVNIGEPFLAVPRPFEPRSDVQRMATERKVIESSLVPYYSPGDQDGNFETRNMGVQSSKTTDNSLNVENHRKLLQRLQDDKKERKQREELRRQKNMQKYTQEIEEKIKIDQELKEKLAEDKLKRHKKKLQMITKLGEDRKTKNMEAGKIIKEITASKPLYLKA